MADAGVDDHDSMIEQSSPRAAESDQCRASMVRSATMAVCTWATITGPIELCTIAALVEKPNWGCWPVTGLTFPPRPLKHRCGGWLEIVLNGQNPMADPNGDSPVGFCGEQVDRVGSYTSASASPGDRLGFDWTPVWIFQTRRCANKHSTLSSGLCSLSRVWFGIQGLQAMSGHFWKLPSEKQFN